MQCNHKPSNMQTGQANVLVLLFLVLSKKKKEHFSSAMLCCKLRLFAACIVTFSSSLRKQSTFRDATTGLPANRRLRNERRNSWVVSSDWLKQIFYVA